jgi:hypothetical protein
MAEGCVTYVAEPSLGRANPRFATALPYAGEEDRSSPAFRAAGVADRGGATGGSGGSERNGSGSA